MRDKGIRRRPAQLAALREHRVKAFCLTRSGNALQWEMLVLLVRYWDAIEHRAAEEQGPFLYAITSQGLTRQSIERQTPQVRPERITRPRAEGPKRGPIEAPGQLPLRPQN